MRPSYADFIGHGLGNLPIDLVGMILTAFVTIFIHTDKK